MVVCKESGQRSVTNHSQLRQSVRKGYEGLFESDKDVGEGCIGLSA